jgi:hypothetical protein
MQINRNAACSVATVLYRRLPRCDGKAQCRRGGIAANAAPAEWPPYAGSACRKKQLGKKQ